MADRSVLERSGYRVVIEAVASAPVPIPRVPRREIAPNVVALTPEDRARVENPHASRPGRRAPHIVIIWQTPRLRPGAFAILWNDCVPEDKGAMVELLAPHPVHYLGWWCRPVSRALVESNGDGRPAPGMVRACLVKEDNLRRCQPPGA